MRITQSFKFFAVLLVLISSGYTYAFGQDSYIKGRWNIKAGYSEYGLGSWDSYPLTKENTTGHYRLETNYGLFNAIETGIYFGYSERAIGFRETDPTMFYGLNVNLHPLPFFLELKNPLFEVYLAGKFGGRYYIKNHTEYSIGGGLSFYIFRNVGLYTEYLYGNHGAFVHYKDHMKLRYGLTVRF
ncbi:MAG: hypothetical protein ACFCUM_17760 [Bacteroidales bacterium]